MIIHRIWDDSSLAFDHRQPCTCCVPSRIRSCNGFAMDLACLRGFFPSRCKGGMQGQVVGNQPFPMLQRWDDMHGQMRCGCFDVVRWELGAATGGRRENLLPASLGVNLPLHLCRLLTTMAMRPVTLRMKWVQGPTSKGAVPACTAPQAQGSTEHLWLGCWKPLGIAREVLFVVIV